MKFCDKLVRLRKSKGMSQEELANELGVSRQAVYKYESGDNMPELDNIKKIAKLFNVSFDLLLDDDKDVSDIGQEKENIIIKEESPKQITYRKVFNSGITLDSFKQSDYEHGFVEDKRATDEDVFREYSEKHERLIKAKGYTKTVRVQFDVLCDFFFDDKNKVFGFFFDGAPQFVCPYENFAAFSLGDSGLTNQHSRTTVVGVGFGRSSSIGIGSIPMTQTGLPYNYDLNISYFDEKGILKVYKISFTCSRVYIVYEYNITSDEKMHEVQNMISEATSKRLREIAAYLDGIKEAANQIKNGLIPDYSIDAKALVLEFKKGQDEKRDRKEKYDEYLETKRKTKVKILKILLIIVFAVLAIIITTCSIKTAVKNHQIAEENREKSQVVINYIDDIGEVTLSSDYKISIAENSYNRLTADQKSLVTNYNILTQAKSKYEVLLDAKREEDTKNDPSRTIVVSDLLGGWVDSYNDEWYIMNISGGEAVLMPNLATAISENLKSSYIVGFNNKTRRMELKLYSYSIISSKYLDVSMTKSSSGELTLYYSNRTFKRKK